MEFHDICSTLIDKKANLGEKIGLLKQLKDTEKDYDQIAADWLCSTIEYVSNTSKYISLNSCEINELLNLLNSKLEENALSSKKLVLKPNIFEVLTRFFCQTDIINTSLLLNSWSLLLHDDSWKQNLTIKANVVIDSLAWSCEHYITNNNNDDELTLNVVSNLLQCYLNYIRSQYNSKKVFSIFCNKLFIWLMCLRGKCSSQRGDHLSIAAGIDKLFAAALCSREHVMNLKMVLKSTLSHEPPAKRPKVDKSDTEKESLIDNMVDNSKKKEEVSFKKTKDLYFHILFDKLGATAPELEEFVLKSLGKLYQIMVASSRASELALTRYEEFALMLHLTQAAKLKINLCKKVELVAMAAADELLVTIIDYCIYQRAEDNAHNSSFHDWMKDLTNIVLNGFDSCDSVTQSIALKVMLKILNVNHTVLEPLLSRLWKICLENEEDESMELLNAKESLLCNLIITYEKLHQLDRLFSSFNPMEINAPIVFPVLFIKRFESAISELLTKEISGILEIYLEKLKNIVSNSPESSIDAIGYLTYLLCYKVLMNAAVIPANGYQRPDLKMLIEKIKELTEYVKYFADNFSPSGTGIVTQMQISALIQHGINNVTLFLKEFSLLTEEDGKLFTKDLDDMAKKFDLNNPISKYLLAALCFDNLNDGTITNKLVSLTATLYKYASESFTESTEKWNGQIFNIHPQNFSDALIMLFKDNISSILGFNDKNLIYHGVNILWKKEMLSWESEEIKELAEKTLHHVICYNSIQFQFSLLASIQVSLPCFLKFDSCIDFNKLIGEKIDIETILECRSKFSLDEQFIGSTDEKIHDEHSLITNFKVIQNLPFEYFTEQNLFTLSLIVLHVWNKLRKTENVKLCRLTIQTLEKVLGTFFGTSHASCCLPLGFIFNSLLEYSIENSTLFCAEDTIMSAIVSTTKVVLKYPGKEDITAEISNKLLRHLNQREMLEVPVAVMERVLVVFCQMLGEPTIKSRSEQAVYQIVFATEETLLQLITSLKDKEELLHNLISIFASLCQIVQHAQQKRHNPSSFDLLEDKLADALSIANTAMQLVNSTAEREAKKHLQVTKFLYSTSHEFTLRLRSLLEKTESDLISDLLIYMECNVQLHNSCSDLISTIVLAVDGSRIAPLLNILTEKLVRQLNGSSKETILKLWYMLLKSKWNKEQRIALWEFLPKVMITCVHMSKRVETIDELIQILHVLVAAVNIGKNSLMTQYVNIVYHLFVILPGKMDDLKFSRFAVVFEEMFQLTSQLLFHHQSSILSSFHAYINAINSLLKLLVSFLSHSLFDGRQEESWKCFERMSRLYQEIGNHKAGVSKYSPYIISGFISTCIGAPFNSSEKRLLERGIYCIMDTCTEVEFALLNTTLHKADKAYYNVIKGDYEKHHKFTGKA